jgi:hypothetical protein
MVKSSCDICGATLQLPGGQVHNGTELPVTVDGKFALRNMDLCSPCWIDLQAWVDSRIALVQRVQSVPV